MAITEVSAGDTIAAATYNEIKDHLEGEASSTLAWFLRCAASENFVIRLSDAAGAQKLTIQDSAGVEVASIDSDGALTISGTFTPGTIILPNAASPAPTTEADIRWDSDDNRLVVGDGAATQTFYPVEAPLGTRSTLMKTADETVNNSTTLQNDDTITFTVTTNSIYHIEGVVWVNSSAVADFKSSWSIPTNAVKYIAIAAGQMDAFDFSADSEWSDNLNLGQDASDNPYYFKGVVHVTDTAGSVTLQWAQNTGEVSDTKVLKNTWIQVERVGAYTA